MTGFGICHLSSIALRAEPSHKSEMISQLLFGELYVVSNKKDDWLEIICLHDEYKAWMPENQYFSITEKESNLMQKLSFSVVLDVLSSTSSSNRSLPILAGSTLYNFDGLNFQIGKTKYVFTGQAITPGFNNFQTQIEKIAFRYLEAPYMWGGRSPLGIDCSGFTQIVYKFFGISLKRDAYQQAEQGVVVNFIEEAQPGDLAFFHNNEGKITHVGIILTDRKIIHSSGKVRIDSIDHFGIFNADSKKYSHQLKIIKRIC